MSTHFLDSDKNSIRHIYHSPCYKNLIYRNKTQKSGIYSSSLAKCSVCLLSFSLAKCLVLLLTSSQAKCLVCLLSSPVYNGIDSVYNGIDFVIFAKQEILKSSNVDQRFLTSDYEIKHYSSNTLLISVITNMKINRGVV